MRANSVTGTVYNFPAVSILGDNLRFTLAFLDEPTHTTIGAVTLQAQAVPGFLASLGIAEMEGSELLALLAVWDPAQADTGTPANRAQLLASIQDFLDPDGDGLVAVLKWDTLEERGTIGFYVERQKAGHDTWWRINGDLLPGLIDAPQGGEYLLVDPQAQSGTSYYYRIIEQEARGGQRSYGPWPVRFE